MICLLIGRDGLGITQLWHRLWDQPSLHINYCKTFLFSKTEAIDFS